MKYTIALLSILLLFGSCRKDKTEPFPDTAPLPLAESSPEIIIGDTTGMKIKSVNYTLYYPEYYTQHLSIPIWHQDTNDFIPTSIINHGPGPWASYGLTFTSNSSLEFMQTENGFITYEMSDSFYNNTTPVQEVHVNGYTCNIGESNTIIHEMKDQLLYLNEGDMLSVDDYSSNVADVIRAEPYNQPSYDYSNPDTTVISGQSKKISCNNMTVNEAHIGIKMDIQGANKLGWIKISNGGGNGIAINIDQIAIQR